MFHKAVLDRKSPSTVARLARQVGLMYEEVERCLAGATLVSYFDKSWLVGGGCVGAVGPALKALGGRPSGRDVTYLPTYLHHVRSGPIRICGPGAAALC